MKSSVLAFDCSFDTGALALLDLQQIDLERVNLKHKSNRIEKTWDNRFGSHSDQLPLKIKEAFEELGSLQNNSKKQESISKHSSILKDLKLIAVGVGPGRFTGIRTALSVAKSLAYSLQIPLCPLNSLELIAESFFETNFLEDKKKEDASLKLKKESQTSQDFSKVYVSLQAFKKSSLSWRV